MRKTEFWMGLSGFMGFTFFLIANFSDFFLGLNVLAGCIQLLLNAFVLVSWFKGYREKHGFWKFVAAVGVAVPVFMGGITLARVILPAVFN